MMIDNKSNNNNNNKQFVSKKGYFIFNFQFFFLAFLCKNNGTFWDAHPGPSSFLVFL